jgi:hypothetical protein
LAKNSNLSKIAQKRIKNTKLNFENLSRDTSIRDSQQSPTKFNFDKELFGNEQILKDIHRIAKKQTK